MGIVKGIVRSITEPKEFNGELQIGFTLKDDPDKWYNISDTEEMLKKTKDKFFKKGNEVQFDFENGKIFDIKLIAEAKESEDDMVTFETLLNTAHEMKKPFSIQTECITVDLEKKYALFKAVVTESIPHPKDYEMQSRTFQGHGDATNENVKGEHIKPHFIRMAETRAIVRALKLYTNNAKCAEEEKSTEEK